MSQKKSNSYTAEFKEAAVKLAVESDQPIAQSARELGVNVNTLHTWIDKFHGKQESPSKGGGVVTAFPTNVSRNVR